MNHQLKTIALAIATVLPTTALADWDGGYAGVSLGSNIKNEVSADLDGGTATFEADDSTSLGIFGGFQLMSGDFVFGGEVAYSNASDLEFELEGEEFDADYDILDLKGRAGFAPDNIFFYGVLGYSRISDGDDVADGISFGAGADFDLGNDFVVGAEYLARRTTFEDSGVDLDIDVDTFAIRAAFSF